MAPVRRPAKRRSSSCTTGVFPLVGVNADVLSFEGRLDLDFQWIMAAAAHVHSYVEQPETFRLMVGGQIRRYTPDGLAYTRFGRIYFEVKPKLKLARSPDLDGKLPSIIADCKSRSASFCIVTEDQIRVGDLVRNSTAVWSAAQQIGTAEVQRTCRALRSTSLPATMSQIANLLGERCWFFVKALIGLRYLATDLSKSFSQQTLITRGSREW
ncbi:Tn7 transposase TnsA N-terminal domain-containing protein [Pacificimonas sp. ICDLI1SI03]